MSTWHPFETAPKDGRRILAYGPKFGITMIRWHGPETSQVPGWTDDMFGDRSVLLAPDFTHWMPLPDPPGNEHGDDTALTYLKKKWREAINREEQLREAVNDECTCGGRGPYDDGACVACRIWWAYRGVRADEV